MGGGGEELESQERVKLYKTSTYDCTFLWFVLAILGGVDIIGA